jgi:hypothetical protein
MPDETKATPDTQPATECHPQPPLAIGRLEVSDVRAELALERATDKTFPPCHIFPPDALAKAMRGEYDATAVATTEEVEADHV